MQDGKVGRVVMQVEVHHRNNVDGDYSGFVARKRSAMKKGQYSLPRTSLNPTSRIIFL